MRRLVRDDFERAFDRDGGVDVLITPTTPTAAPTIAEATALSQLEGYANDVFTVPASLAGLPAISVPGGLSSEGLPLGLHLIGKAFDEQTLFRTAQALEYAAGFDTRPHRG